MKFEMEIFGAVEIAAAAEFMQKIAENRGIPLSSALVAAKISTAQGNALERLKAKSFEPLSYRKIDIKA